MIEFLNTIIRHKGLTNGIVIGSDISYGYLAVPELYYKTCDEFLSTDSETDVIVVDGLINYDQFLNAFQKCKQLISNWGIVVLHNIPSPALINISNDPDLLITNVPDLDVYIVQKKGIARYTPIQEVNSCDWVNMMDYEKYVVVCIAKGEYKTLLDWVDYHIRLGFDKIVIYDNNDIDGERYQELLHQYISNGQVLIVDIRGMLGMQHAVYNEFYQLGNYKWVAVFDCDEFLQFKDHCPHKDVKSFIDAKSDAYAYLIPWECKASRPMGSTDPIYTWDKSLPTSTRRDSAIDSINVWMKTIYRHGFKHTLYEHSIAGTQDGCGQFHMYDENQQIIDNQGEFMIKHDLLDPNVPQCVFAHYLLKDIDEFFYRKYLRGHAGLGGAAGVDGYTQTFWNQNLNYFAELSQTLTADDQKYLLEKGFRINFTFRPTVIFIINIINDDIEYYSKLKQIINPLIQNCDSFFTINTRDGLYESETYKCVYGDPLPLYKSSWWWSWGLDLPKNSISQTETENHFLQPPIVLHVGYPVKLDPNEYLDKLQKTLLNPQKFTNICRDICFFKQCESMLYAPNNLIEYDYNDYGWSTATNDIYKENQMNPRHIRIHGNSFITNLHTYTDICSLISKHIPASADGQNDQLFKDIDDGYSTIYDMMCVTYPSVVDEVYEIPE